MRRRWSDDAKSLHTLAGAVKTLRRSNDSACASPGRQIIGSLVQRIIPKAVASRPRLAWGNRVPAQHQIGGLASEAPQETARNAQADPHTHGGG